MMKEMLRAFILGWLRNVEVLNKDSTKGRGQEDMTINNEPVFFGGMNRAPAYINPAFRRRVAFKTCVQFQRADGVTFEQAKEKEEQTRNDAERIKWAEALRDNAKLHLMAATAEYYGVISPPELAIWNSLTEQFKKAVNQFVSVSNFSERIADAKTRLEILIRMIAVFETYQQEDQVLSFHQIIARLPEVKRWERLYLTVLSGLDDVVFPLVRAVQVCEHYQAPC
jgi:hypothetical protein